MWAVCCVRRCCWRRGTISPPRKIDEARLREIEGSAITDAVAMQAGVGLQSATDGEFRRATWHMDFIYQIGGI